MLKVARFERPAMRVQARVGGQQGRVHVEHAAGVAPDEAAVEDAHEPGEGDESRAAVINGLRERLAPAGAVGMDGRGHDRGRDAECARPLEPGVVLTVEPGLYVSATAEVAPEWRGIGIRIEDDILVTADGSRNLTESIPKRADELEQILAQRA